MRWSLWSRGRVVVSHASALAVHDLGIANPAEIYYLTVPPCFRQKDSAVVLHRSELTDKDVSLANLYALGCPFTSSADHASWPQVTDLDEP